MRTKLISVAAVIPGFTVILCTALPAHAITVELAKKCREMAIKAHPQSPPGTSPYAEAEREFYHECISKNGVMPSTGAGSPDKPPPKPN